jgi:hypothetical protein
MEAQERKYISIGLLTIDPPPLSSLPASVTTRLLICEPQGDVTGFIGFD